MKRSTDHVPLVEVDDEECCRELFQLLGADWDANEKVVASLRLNPMLATAIKRVPRLKGRLFLNDKMSQIQPLVIKPDDGAKFHEVFVDSPEDAGRLPIILGI